jgi:two-component system, NarL family, secretion system response regulator SalR
MQASEANEFLNDLTITERKVLILIVEGLTNQEIATALNSAEGTVKKHREHIYRKANVTGSKAIRKFINEIRPYLTSDNTH